MVVAPAPFNVSVSPANVRGALAIHWLPPRITDSLPLISYSLQFKESASEDEYSQLNSILAYETHTFISNLKLKTEYSMRIAGITELGTGTFSDPKNVTTFNGECEYNI